MLNLPESFLDQPARTKEGPRDRGRIRTTDFSVAEELLSIKRAQSPEYVRANLRNFEGELQRTGDPFGREKVPSPQPDQPVFLLGEKGGQRTREENQGTAPHQSQGEQRGAELGQRVYQQIRRQTPTRTREEKLQDTMCTHHLTARDFVIPPEALVEAGFRRVEEQLIAFFDSTPCVEKGYSAVLPEFPGPEVFTHGNQRNKPFAHAAGVAFHHAAKDFVAPGGIGRLESTNWRFYTDGFILNPDGKVTVVGFSSYYR